MIKINKCTFFDRKKAEEFALKVPNATIVEDKFLGVKCYNVFYS